jgi:vacuolar-type H+-ATPase subunit H
MKYDYLNNRRLYTMTETQQHQEPIKHAEEHAEAVITAALQAGQMLDDALDRADPKLILSSQARLKQVQHEMMDAKDQLSDVNSGHKYDAQLQRVSESIHYAQEDVELAMDEAHMTKQRVD